MNQVRCKNDMMTSAQREQLFLFFCACYRYIISFFILSFVDTSSTIIQNLLYTKLLFTCVGLSTMKLLIRSLPLLTLLVVRVRVVDCFSSYPTTTTNSFSYRTICEKKRNKASGSLYSTSSTSSWDDNLRQLKDLKEQQIQNDIMNNIFRSSSSTSSSSSLIPVSLVGQAKLPLALNNNATASSTTTTINMLVLTEGEQQQRQNKHQR